MRIRVTGHSGEDCFPFSTGGPWRKFAEVFLTNGHQICELDLDQPADALIANSHSKKFIDYCEFNSIPRERRVLVLWEPYVVETTRYRKRVLANYGHIFAPSILWADRIKGLSFNWPQDEVASDLTTFTNWSDRHSAAVMIQGNKFSARKGELYSFRRRVLNGMSLGELSLFGTDWNRGIKFDWWHWSRSALNSKISDLSASSLFGIGRKYESYLGPVEDKAEILRKYKICVVIENSADFVSEKLFDSVRAGCFTIYLGPKLSAFGIPDNAAYQSLNEPTKVIESIKYFLNLPSETLLAMTKIQMTSLAEISRDWENTYVLSKLAENIEERISQSH